MMNFPASPTVMQVYSDATTGTSYQWDGVAWRAYGGLSVPLPVSVGNGGTGAVTSAAALTNLGAMPQAGGTMGGALTVTGNITASGSAGIGATVPAGSTLASVFTPVIISTNLASGVYYDGVWKHWSGGSANGNLLQMDNDIVFSTSPSGAADGAATFTERFRISNSSGLTTLGAGLSVTGTITQNHGGGVVQQLNTYTLADCHIQTNNSRYSWKFGVQGYASPDYFFVYDVTASRLCISISPSGACAASSTWGLISDMRLKEASSIAEYPRGLQEILALNPIYYQWNGKGGVPADGEIHFGLAAQDVEAVLPELIREMEYTPPEGAREDDEPMTLKTYSPTDITFALVNAIKELKAQIDELRAQLAPYGNVAWTKAALDAASGLAPRPSLGAGPSGGRGRSPASPESGVRDES